MKSLIDLPVGAVLSTGISRESECEIFIGSQRRFTATVGRVKQKLSAQVIDPITDGPAPRAPGRSNNESR
jgi:flagellar motor switch protein FliM